MSAGVVLLVVLALLVAAFVAFYRYSRTAGWEQSETRRALLNVIVAVGPLLGMHHRPPRPPLPGIMTPGPEPDEDADEQDGEQDGGGGSGAGGDGLQPGHPRGDEPGQVGD